MRTWHLGNARRLLTKTAYGRSVASGPDEVDQGAKVLAGVSKAFLRTPVESISRLRPGTAAAARRVLPHHWGSAKAGY
jgi:hypothetical protein